jgi:hypothetical protein
VIRLLTYSGGRSRWGRWQTLGASIYTLVVAGTAAIGFTTESTHLILFAAALALPTSILAMPAYYFIYGM